VGVDVEHIRPDFTGEEIWERFFSQREREALRALPEADRPLAFFQCWTRKEAYIKGAGPGLSIPLHSFDVTLGPGVPAQLLATRPDGDEAARWVMEALEPGEEYAGAVAVLGAGWELRTFDWPSDA
jgi:4'-phosphopantetheinyl transferase